MNSVLTQQIIDLMKQSKGVHEVLLAIVTVQFFGILWVIKHMHSIKIVMKNGHYQERSKDDE